MLTGATGALGQEVLCQWLETRPQQEQLLVLARGKGKGKAEKRVENILRKRFTGEALAQAEKRVTVLNGDMNVKYLGLEPKLYQEVVEHTEQVIHCAAAVRFDQPLENARETNLEGTRNTLQLAKEAQKAGRMGRFDYVSTAYIAGKRHGVIYEHEFNHKKGFHNTYEQSKYEAETMVRQAMGDIPVSVYRPSIIIGNSRTGETSDFKAFYWPMRAYAIGQLRVLPGVASCKVDLVPVDYVAAAIIHLNGQKHSINRSFHLTAGRDNLPTVSDILDAAVSFFKVKRPFLIPPLLLKVAEGKLGYSILGERGIKTLKLGEPYYPYFSLKLEYDNRQTLEMLKPVGIYPPRISEFFERLFRYCVETEWGKRTTHHAGKTSSEESNDKDLVSLR